MSRTWKIVGGLALGAGMIYLLDPYQGKRRRATLLGRREITGDEWIEPNDRTKGIEVHESLTVRAPIEQVFEFWTHFHEFPRFMSHVKQVYRSGDDRSHWKVTGPAGTTVEFDTVVTRSEPPRLLAWKSLPDSPIEVVGHVWLEPISEHRTWVGVHMSYNPPAGAVGHMAAVLFGANPRKMLAEDLVRMKALIESAMSPQNNEGDPIGRWGSESPAAPAPRP